MISAETITTWLEEFGLSSSKHYKEDDITKAYRMLEWQTNMQGNMIAAEPKFVAMMTTLFNVLKFENSLSAAIYCLAAYYDCERRQREADELKEDLS